MAQYPVSQVMTDINSNQRGQNTVNYVKTAGGLYIPQKGKDDGTTVTADADVLAQLQSVYTKLDAVNTRLNSTLDSRVVESSVMLPIDVQGHLQQSAQVLTNVSVTPSGASVTVFVDTNGFDKIAVIAKSDAAHNQRIKVTWSNDGVTVLDGNGDIFTSSNDQSNRGITETKQRYARIELRNDDAAGPHVMSAWVYLKA